jgi:hypothetical protein
MIRDKAQWRRHEIKRNRASMIGKPGCPEGFDTVIESSAPFQRAIDNAALQNFLPRYSQPIKIQPKRSTSDDSKTASRDLAPRTQGFGVSG